MFSNGIFRKSTVYKSFSIIITLNSISQRSYLRQQLYVSIYFNMWDIKMKLVINA